MRGLPSIRDTRVTVSAVLGQFAAGASVDELLGDYPYLEREDVLAALEYASDVSFGWSGGDPVAEEVEGEVNISFRPRSSCLRFRTTWRRDLMPSGCGRLT
jgi:hypothetical protein